VSDFRSRPMFQSRASDSLDKILLGFAFLLGITGSIFLKVYNFDIWVPAIFSGTIIVVYALSAYTLPRVQLESDQVGDNAYYLGFVLTLTSLSFTLYELSGENAKAEFIADVIAGFGIALSSTIVGVAVRVMFLQFRLDLVARDREARLTLSDAMRQFRAELSDTIRGVKFLGIEIRQSLNEHHNELAKSHAAVSDALHAEMLNAFKNALKPAGVQMIRMIEEVTENATASVTASAEARADAEVELRTAIGASAKSIGSDMAEVLKVLEAGISASTTRVSEVSAQLEHQLTGSADGIRGFSEQLTKQFAQTSRMIAESSERTSATTSKAIEDATAALASSIARISSVLQEPTDGLSRKLGDVSQSFAQVMQELERRTDILKSSSELTESGQRALSESVQRAVNEMSSFTDQLKQLEVSYLTGQQELVGQLGKVHADIRAASRAPQLPESVSEPQAQA
jgi:hypothetical protein